MVDFVHKTDIIPTCRSNHRHVCPNSITTQTCRLAIPLLSMAIRCMSVRVLLMSVFILSWIRFNSVVFCRNSEVFFQLSSLQFLPCRSFKIGRILWSYWEVKKKICGILPTTYSFLFGVILWLKYRWDSVIFFIGRYVTTALVTVLYTVIVFIISIIYETCA